MAYRVSFLQNNRYDPATGCWNWTGARSEGYGTIRFMGRVHKVHRVAAHLYLRFDLASPLKVLHSCDNPACFNPRHLFIGTQLDNVRDMISKGRDNFKGALRIRCKNGHPRTRENLIGRNCRQCRQEWREKRKAQGLGT